MVSRTGSERLRLATAEDNPDAKERDSTRRWVEEAAAYPDWPPQPQPPPTLLQKAGSLAGSIIAFAKSGLAVVDRDEFERRHSICEACPHFDAKKERCKLCGCSLAVKPWGRDMHCPDNPPRW